ncbi:MAG: manganese efflux pump MntP family protein [Elusimicrobiota bacterium]|nr:manganese efflux pump MntP family protein [Elusimicrobiota bacterium]
MSLLEIIFIAIGLSMDAFAVSISLGLSVKKAALKQMIIAGFYFGLFQAIMPVAGFFLGLNFAGKISAFDHWIAFILLGFIGAKMIRDSLSHKESKSEIRENENPFSFFKMLPLAFATSIDALAVGITFALLQVSIFKAALLIGAITFFISLLAVKIGNMFGTKFKSKAEFVGGLILVLLGIKILAEHILL